VDSQEFLQDAPGRVDRNFLPCELPRNHSQRCRTDATRKEIDMTTLHGKRYRFTAHDVARLVRAAAILIGLVTLTYVVAVAGEHAGPLLDAFSQYALEYALGAPATDSSFMPELEESRQITRGVVLAADLEHGKEGSKYEKGTAANQDGKNHYGIRNKWIH